MLSTDLPGTKASPPSRPDSDDALRNLKASEAADAAFIAAGYPSAPPALKAIVTARAKSVTENIPADQLSGGGGIIATEAAAGVSMAMASLSDAQRNAIKNGSDLDPRTQRRLEGILLGLPFGLRQLNGSQADRGDAGGGSSGIRFGELPGVSSDWTRLPQVREAQGLAVNYGMSWACNNRELMMLGPSAIQALHDVDLKKRSYDDLTKGASFKASEVVILSKFAKEKHIDANQLSGTLAHGVRALAGDNVPERRKLDGAFSGYMEHPEKPETKRQLFKTLDPYADDAKKKPEVYKMLDAVKIRHEEFDAAHAANRAVHASTDSKLSAFDSLPSEPPASKPDGSKPAATQTPPATRPIPPKPNAPTASTPKL